VIFIIGKEYRVKSPAIQTYNDLHWRILIKGVSRVGMRTGVSFKHNYNSCLSYTLPTPTSGHNRWTAPTNMGGLFHCFYLTTGRKVCRF
jgi:hypothetical protein